MKVRVLILIPARYHSSRFSGKPLAVLLGKSMVLRTFENAQEFISSGHFEGEVAIVTDDQRIEDHCHEMGIDICRVDDDVTTGTERIFLAFTRYYKEKNFDYIINVQGDEPLLGKLVLRPLLDFHIQNPFDIVTAVHKHEKKDDFQNPNRVKTIFSEETGRCLYFSRSAIPFSRDETNEQWYSHIGVYSFTPHSLESFMGLAESYYEKIEKLEQLRALENGLTVGAICTTEILYGVDTPEDIKLIEGVLRDKIK